MYQLLEAIVAGTSGAVGGGADPVPTTVAAGLALGALVGAAWLVLRRTGRRPHPDRGGRGWVPRGVDGLLPPRALDADPPPERPASPVEHWLLALPAPFVEQADLDHSAWSLAPAAADHASRRRVEAAVVGAGLRERDAWRARREAAQQQVTAATTAAQRAYAVAWAAWVLRLGVAAGHLRTYHAREDLLRTVGAVVGQYGDWPTFGDDFLEEVARRATPQQAEALRTAVGRLCRPGGAWGGRHWPVEAL
ncbi:hypothetical protein GCM10023216_09590 [Isoptericola chiayiensis]|uniref:DUF1266 domain-containing protein n=1 Tax=Isoptericola chiayiensis TaxID=579446 RepID=A0ABP8Y5P8_9MICO|nr:hypothetical protein [Isoptericola chiayiensis]NOW00598.1 hypothetical protein [Isoptericola chiayiensis]